MQRMPRVASALVWAWLLASCSDNRTTCPQTPCLDGEVCHDGVCVAPCLSCASDQGCINDTFCEQGCCIPYGSPNKLSDEQCARPTHASGQLETPRLACAWNAEGVRMTPLVADLEGDGATEIVFVSEDGSLVILAGDGCQQRKRVASDLSPDSQLAVGDLDGDGKLEIVGIDAGQHVLVYSHDGQLIARSQNGAKIYTSRFYGGPALANLDGEGAAELVYGGLALRLEGGTLTELYNVKVDGAERGHLAVLADLDADGLPELVSGNGIFDGATGLDETPEGIAALRPGFAAVADLDATAGPEVVLVSSEEGEPAELRVYKPDTGEVVFGPYSFGTSAGGPPTVADFDGDGQAEIGVAADQTYVVFDSECAADPLPPDCEAPGIRWQKSIRDRSSGSTGSSVFDFDGDGAAEVIYRDECWLRIYAGATGTLLAATSVSSGTWIELPVIADVDDDGHAELVVVADDSTTDCEDEPEAGLAADKPQNGVLVFESQADQWAAARPLWNQHTYHVTNIDDDGTLPLFEQPNWSSWNNFRQNTQGLLPSSEPAADLTARTPDDDVPEGDCESHWLLRAEVCNRGAATVAAGIRGAFYADDPLTDGTRLCEAITTTALAPGSCEVVSCAYPDFATSPPTAPIDLWYLPDDPRLGEGVSECKEENNPMHVPQAICTPVAP